MSITKTAKQKLSVFIRAVPFMTDFSKKDIFNSTIKRHSLKQVPRTLEQDPKK